jgi:hypothetical protein
MHPLTVASAGVRIAAAGIADAYQPEGPPASAAWACATVKRRS